MQKASLLGRSRHAGKQQEGKRRRLVIQDLAATAELTELADLEESKVFRLRPSPRRATWESASGSARST